MAIILDYILLFGRYSASKEMTVIHYTNSITNIIYFIVKYSKLIATENLNLGPKHFWYNKYEVIMLLSSN